jgi:hypothetical protein
MDNTDMHAYVELEGKFHERSFRKGIFVACCGVLSLGVLITLYQMAPNHEHKDSVIDMAGKHMLPAKGRQILQPKRGMQFVQPAKVWQPMQPLKTRQFLHVPRAATMEEESASAPGPSAFSAASELEAKKQAVFNALEVGSDATTRAALATALPQLEASNPTKEPALSPMIVGKWNIRYTGAVAMGPVDSPTREIALMMYAAGFSPGVAALSLANRLPDNLVQVKAVGLEIPTLPGESTATLGLSILNGQTEGNVELKCELVATGPSKLTETGKEVRYDGGTPVQVPVQFQYARDLVVTYVDEQLLVVRDATGSPDILVRESMPPIVTPPEEPVIVAPDSS